MNRRERQYFVWVKFWKRRRKYKIVKIETKTEYGFSYTMQLPPCERVRVPDSKLIKMGRL